MQAKTLAVSGTQPTIHTAAVVNKWLLKSYSQQISKFTGKCHGIINFTNGTPSFVFYGTNFIRYAYMQM